MPDLQEVARTCINTASQRRALEAARRLPAAENLHTDAQEGGGPGATVLDKFVAASQFCRTSNPLSDQCVNACVCVILCVHVCIRVYEYTISAWMWMLYMYMCVRARAKSWIYPSYDAEPPLRYPQALISVTMSDPPRAHSPAYHAHSPRAAPGDNR